MTLCGELLFRHLQAAYGCEGAPVVKGDGYYAAPILGLSGKERRELIETAKENGFEMTIEAGPVSGGVIRIRCIDSKKAKSVIDAKIRMDARMN